MNKMFEIMCHTILSRKTPRKKGERGTTNVLKTTT